MVRTIAKTLQVLGLIILPAAMLMQLTAGIRAPTGQGITVSAMLLLLIFGCGLFCFGKLLEGTAR